MLGRNMPPQSMSSYSYVLPLYERVRYYVNSTKHKQLESKYSLLNERLLQTAILQILKAKETSDL